MSCTNCHEGGGKSFDYTYLYNANCTDCNTICGGNTVDSKCVGYFGGNLPCSGIVTNDSLELALGKIETAICNASGNYSTYTYHCLTPVTTEADFVSEITAYVCATEAALVAFTGTTFPDYQGTIVVGLDAIRAPGVTSTYAGVTSGDSLNTVLGKYGTAFDNLAAAQDISAVDWDLCYTVVTPPTTLPDAFTQLLSQICSTKTIASAAATLPVFNNTGTCLASPGSADTLVDTVDKIITRTCLSPILDNTSLTSSCVAIPSTSTDLQTLVQSILTKIDTLTKNFPTFNSSDFAVTNVNNSYSCLGKSIALQTPINQDRLVASDSIDNTPGTLVTKLQAGTNIGIDNTTTPGKIIINAPTNVDTLDSNSIDFTGVGTSASKLTADIKISATAGNMASINTDGLFVTPIPAATLTFTETYTTKPTEVANVVTMDVKIDASQPDNILVYSTNGLYVPNPSNTVTVVTATPSSSLNVSATPGSGNSYVITGNVRISGASNNALISLSDGIALRVSADAGNSIVIHSDGIFATTTTPDSFENGITETGGVVELGGTLTGNTVIDTATFNLTLTKVSSAANASAYPIYGTVSYTGTGSESGQYAIVGILGAMGFNGAYNFTPDATSKHGAISGTAFKSNKGNWVGIFPALYGDVELADTGNVTTTASLRASKPTQKVGGVAFSGTVTNACGIYIDDINASSLSAQFTNKFAIYQPGTLDVSRFFGPVQNASASVQFTSDARVKENIVPFTRGLVELELIVPHKFNFTYNKTNQVVGVIAQELEVIIPEAVTQGNFDVPNPKDANTPLESFTDFRMVDQNVLFFTMLTSIQELNIKVKSLETRLFEVESKVK